MTSSGNNLANGRWRQLAVLLKYDARFGLPPSLGVMAGTTISHRYAPSYMNPALAGPATTCRYCYGWADDYRHLGHDAGH